jgi:hypothetical protein
VGVIKQRNNGLKKMKNLLLTLAVVSLMACNSNEETINTECCHSDATDLPFDIDSITNVKQLLDSLNEVPKKKK